MGPLPATKTRRTEEVDAPRFKKRYKTRKKRLQNLQNFTEIVGRLRDRSTVFLSLATKPCS
jgi:hypothetical protein